MTRPTSYIHGWNADDFTIDDVTKATLLGMPPVIALKSQRRAVSLPGQGILFYSGSGDIFARSKAFAPTAKISWDFVEIIGHIPTDQDLNSPTHLHIRAHNGTDSMFWDGAAWVVAGVGDWNEESVFNENLSTFDSDSLAVEIQLKTNDGKFTPTLECVRLRWTGEFVNTVKETIYDAVVCSLLDNLRPLSPAIVPANGTAAVAFATGDLDGGFKITDVVSVFDHTTDPDHDSDLLVSYVAGVITLSAVTPAENDLWVVFAYQPHVAVTTSSDYVIGAELPAIWITSITPGPRKMLGEIGPWVIDRTLAVPAGTVWPNPIPFRDLDFSFAILAPTSLDLVIIGEAIEGWFAAHPLIRLPSLDMEVNLRPGIVPEWNTTTTDEDDTRLATGTFLVKNVPVFGDRNVSSANGGAAIIGPVDAGDPNFPGLGYGVKRLNTTIRTDDGGDEILTVED